MVSARITLSGLLVLAALSGSACKPDIEGRPSLVDSERVLAISSEPAEAPPGATVEYRALYVGPDGVAKATDLAWALCVGRKSLSESGPVNEDCLKAKGKLLSQLGMGDKVTSTVPADTCRLFGPTPPEPMKGEPTVRAADPDTTGGYYQPVRLLIAGDTSVVGVTRISCGVNGPTAEQSVEYAQGYRANENPALDALVIRKNGKETVVPAGATTAVKVAPSERITLRARWTSCPTKSVCGDGICGAKEDLVSCPDDCMTSMGCTGSEPYVYFDPLARAIVKRREAMRVSWFANDGRFVQERTGRTEAEANQTFTENDWTAPSKPGEVLLWVVVRDDRGGVGFASYKLDVAK